MRLTLSVFLTLCVWAAHAKTIPVGKDMQVKTITHALSIAADGDSIIVHPGLYREGQIFIRKKVFLIGKGHPVLDGQMKHEVISVKSDDVEVAGFKVINSGRAAISDPCGIKVYDSNNVVIRNNILDDNFFGIYIQNGKNCIVRDNVITAYGKVEQLTGNGIHCWKGENLQIIGNRIKGHRDGIYFEFVTESVIWRNIAERNLRYGLHFMFSHNDAYISNVFRNNGAGVAVMFTRNVKMFNNYFDQNWGDSAYGLLLKEISDSYIFNNHFANNTSGIFMEGTSRCKVEQNVFSGNGWGMKIQASCMDNEIVRNNFIRNTFDISTNGSLVLNTFNSNYWDKYEGYDLNRDNVGDIPYHPLSLFAVLTESNPSTMLLYRSFMITLLDKSEKILPSITPDNFVDNTPLMKALPL